MTGLDGEGVRVVLVGTGSHVPDSRLPDVPAVGATAEALRSCLVEICGVREENLVCLVDPTGPEPFLDEVIRAAAAATDVLLIYFVGHGVQDVDGQLYLATRSTADLTNKVSFQALAYREIVGALSNCRARLVLVILDCCYSGRVSVPVRSGALLASADKDEQALAPVGEQYTAFSGELVRALREGIPTAPAQLTLQRLHDHLARTMRRQNRTVPVLQTGNLAGDLVLAANRADRARDHLSHDAADQVVTPWEGDCPYRGLEPFTAEDEQVFHGRAQLVVRVLGRLRERARSGGLTVVAGPSGSGKTSLLYAGILPAIAHGDLGVTGSSSWPQISMAPGEDPLATLATHLAEHTSGHSGDSESIRAELAAGLERARAAVRYAASRATPQFLEAEPARFVIVVDQFEEVFAAGVSDSTRLAFIAALDAVAAQTDSDDPAATVILGLRSDFSGQCARFPELAAALENNQILVGPMTTAELRSAIVAPAHHAGLDLQPGLVDLLLHDTGADPGDDQFTDYDPGALPLLSHALLATWQQRRGNLLTVAGYRGIGGVAGAISTTAEHTFTTLQPATQEAARWLLLHMVRVGDDIPDTRRRVHSGDLLQALPDKTAAAGALEAFAAARLVTVDQDTAEITHEALIRSWPRLRDWMNTDREGRLAAQEVEADSAAWQRGNRDPARLYRGSRLARARDRAHAPNAADLSVTAVDFLTASTRSEQRGARLRRTAVAFLAVLTLLASGLAVLAFQQRAAGNIAISNQILATADELGGTDQSLAAQLDALAYHFHPTPELQTRLLASEGIALSKPLIENIGTVNSAVFSPDGHILATGSDDKTVHLWNMTDPAKPRLLGKPLTFPEAVEQVAFSSNGRKLAIISGDALQSWNLDDPEHPAPNGPPAQGVISMAISPDGHTLALSDGRQMHIFTNLASSTSTGYSQSAVGPLQGQLVFSPDGHMLANGNILWNVADPTHPAPAGQIHIGATEEITSVAFSPDGHTLAAVVGGASGAHLDLWDITDPARPGQGIFSQLQAPSLTSLYSVAFSPDGHTLAVGSQDKAVHFWTVAGDSAANAGNPSANVALTGHAGAVTAVAFSPDGRNLVTGSQDNTVRMWDLPQTVLTGHSGGISVVDSLAFSRDGHTLATSDVNTEEHLWGMTDPAHPAELDELPSSAQLTGGPVAFSPDGRTLASGRDLWNVTDPAHPVRAGQLPTSGGGPVIFSSTGTLVSQYGDTLRFWNVIDPAHPAQVGQMQLNGNLSNPPLALSPDGNLLATSDSRTVSLWNTSGLRHTTNVGHPLPGSTDVIHGGTSTINTVAFSPDGNTLAIGSGDAIMLVNVTDPAHPNVVGQLTLNATVTVNALTYSPDGGTLAIGGGEAVILVNVTNPAFPTTIGEPITGHTAEVDIAAFSPTGHIFATGSSDGTVRIWNMDAGSADARICTYAGNSLTAQQWQLYVPTVTPESFC